MVLWGVRLRKNPPAYLQGRLSFRTKRAKRDADLWNYANTFFSHMILVAGVNGGAGIRCLLHRVYDFDRRSVLGGRGGFASLCSGGVCIVSLSNYGFSRQKMYRSPEDEMEDSAEELKTLRYPDCNEKDIGKK